MISRLVIKGFKHIVSAMCITYEIDIPFITADVDAAPL